MDYTEWVSSAPLVTVVETPEFIRRVEKLLDDEERETLIAYLAANPTAGDVIPGTGGVRKFRFGAWKVAASAEERGSFTSSTARGYRCLSSRRSRRTNGRIFRRRIETAFENSRSCWWTGTGADDHEQGSEQHPQGDSKKRLSTRRAGRRRRTIASTYPSTSTSRPFGRSWE
jgi:hypothetical protein